jgi:Trypsin-like peptidase domain
MIGAPMNPPKVLSSNPDRTSARKRHTVAVICATALPLIGGSGQGRAGENSQYIVDGLALGGPVAQNSAAYREYRCRPSEQFPSFIWCKRHKRENGKFGQFSSVNSILHSFDGTAVYVSRFIEPAFFGSGDIDREIERLSQRFELKPRTIRPPLWWKGSQGIIAYWGDVTLEPLDADGRARIASGQSAESGILFDFLGDFGRSVTENLPIFQLGGGEGYVWGVRVDGNGAGALRMTAIDAAQFAPPASVARLETGRSVGREETDTVVPPVPSAKPKVTASSGSGFFVSSDGHVLTNNHVIEDCTTIRVFMDAAEPVEARAIARDTANDLALLSTGLKPPAVASLGSVLR